MAGDSQADAAEEAHDACRQASLSKGDGHLLVSSIVQATTEHLRLALRGVVHRRLHCSCM